MSLAALLLSDLQPPTTKASRPVVHVDDELDALFRSNLAPPVATVVQTAVPSRSGESPPKPSPKNGLKRKRKERASSGHPLTAANVVSSRASRGVKRQRAETLSQVEAEDVSEGGTENDAWLEDSYFSRRTNRKTVPAPETEDASSEIDDDAPPPVHETHLASSRTKIRSKSDKKVKYVPPDEAPAQRDARTIFVGNVPIAVVKSKSLQKQLKRRFISLITGSRIESMRFRSVAFASATTVLPTEDTVNSSKKWRDGLSTKQQRQQSRAAQWRESTSTDSRVVGKTTGEEDETSEREDSLSQAKKAAFLSPTERKRIAFFKGEFHKDADSVHAYIVFAYTKASGDHEPTTDQVQPLHPFEAARLAVEQCDGSLFMDRTLRVDRVGQWRVGIGKESGGGGTVEGLGDPRVTLFVGNLDFAAREEDLRVWFEGVVSQERGPPPGIDGSVSEDNDGAGGRVQRERDSRWVHSVRIVRDRDTQLGKGFAYVRFLDRECVDEVLGLEPTKLKFAKRKLRVQRCKAVPGSITSPPARQKPTSLTAPRSRKPTERSSVPLPKGDPSLGEKLAGLSKDERKAAKAANTERVKRRLAKKKIKENVLKGQAGKDRKRERTRLQHKTGGSAKVVKKGRTRSEKSMTRRNVKK